MIKITSLKFLIIWRLKIGPQVTPQMGQAVIKMADYTEELRKKGKLEKQYHLVGGHGAVWISDVESNDELELMLARSPVYNFAVYEIYPLTEMKPGIL